MIEKVEDLLFSGSINPDLFKRKTTKIYEDIENINERLEIMELYLSNLIYQIDKCFEVTYNLPIIQSLANVGHKPIIQKTALPSKIEYDEENNTYRTLKI